jgi:hypothetical protein
MHGSTKIWKFEGRIQRIEPWSLSVRASASTASLAGVEEGFRAQTSLLNAYFSTIATQTAGGLPLLTQ